VSLLYNRFGKRIAQVGTLLDGDVVELPRDLIDFTVAQNLWGRYEVKFAAKDILGKEQIFTQAFSGSDRQVKSNLKGTTYSLGLSVKL
jgi:hypothetical protein